MRCETQGMTVNIRTGSLFMYIQVSFETLNVFDRGIGMPYMGWLAMGWLRLVGSLKS